jgi:hypothetical protein
LNADTADFDLVTSSMIVPEIAIGLANDAIDLF